jgi:hypothetical protein
VRNKLCRKRAAVVVQMIEHFTTHHKRKGLNLVTVLALLEREEKQIVRKRVAVVAQLIEHLTTHHKRKGLNQVAVLIL